ncbi:hypothetical protein PVAP13_6KG109942 [Panicum virgatum]|uniref:Uncharacterized protein n=1 Tax=Panicum virgatum TaxID=38727 RepID=A0A8T0R9N8_PANVG|nr:hypothetical protein PVAP13_6KG109942 [Panicum virgatum]
MHVISYTCIRHAYCSMAGGFAEMAHDTASWKYIEECRIKRTRHGQICLKSPIPNDLS